MAEKQRVFFTGGGGAGSEALWRLLSDRYELFFGDADRAAIDPAIPNDRRHALPWADDPEFVSRTGALCSRLGIDLLVPGVDEELLELAKNREQLTPTRLLLPGQDHVETMLDKLLMVRALEDRVIPVPRTVSLDEDFGEMTFPCISKPRRGRGSRGVKLIADRNEALALRQSLGPAAHQTVLQERLTGTEYTVQVVADRSGRLRAVVPVKVGLKRGITLRAETDDSRAVIDACIAIHEAFPTGGCYNIQLMLLANGSAMPFEINPRVSTTLCLVVAAGVDPIAIYAAADDATDELQNYTIGLALERHWHNYFHRPGTDTSA